MLVACMHAKSLQSCPTLCNTMDCSLPGSSVHGILQTKILERIVMPFSRGSSWPEDHTHISCGFCITVKILYHWVTGEAQNAGKVPKSSTLFWCNLSKNRSRFCRYSPKGSLRLWYQWQAQVVTYVSNHPPTTWKLPLPPQTQDANHKSKLLSVLLTNWL